MHAMQLRLSSMKGEAGHCPAAPLSLFSHMTADHLTRGPLPIARGVQKGCHNQTNVTTNPREVEQGHHSAISGQHGTCAELGWGTLLQRLVATLLLPKQSQDVPAGVAGGGAQSVGHQTMQQMQREQSRTAASEDGGRYSQEEVDHCPVARGSRGEQKGGESAHPGGAQKPLNSRQAFTTAAQHSTQTPRRQAAHRQDTV